jgi:LysM domain
LSLPLLPAQPALIADCICPPSIVSRVLELNIKVRRGDTIESLSREYGIPEDFLLKANKRALLPFTTATAKSRAMVLAEQCFQCRVELLLYLPGLKHIDDVGLSTSAFAKAKPHAE